MGKNLSPSSENKADMRSGAPLGGGALRNFYALVTCNWKAALFRPLSRPSAGEVLSSSGRTEEQKMSLDTRKDPKKISRFDVAYPRFQYSSKDRVTYDMYQFTGKFNRPKNERVSLQTILRQGSPRNRIVFFSERR